MKRKKIALVGCGSFGNSFIYSCINQGLADKYVLIDMFKKLIELPLTSEEEKEKFNQSCEISKKTLETAYAAINLKILNNNSMTKSENI